MKRTLILLTLVLLAGCGGQTTLPPEVPTEPLPPPSTPAEPAPITPPPVAPSEGVQYYGEWGWQYQETGDFAPENEGRFSISEVHTEPGFSGSFGIFQTCYYGNCYDNGEGGVLLGTFEGEGLVAILYRLDTSNDPVPVYIVRDADGEIGQDSQGRDVFEGTAQWVDAAGGPRNGNFVATNISGTPIITLSLSPTLSHRVNELLE